MANLEGMPIGSLPELPGDLQDEDEVVVYRPSTGKAYQANTDLIDSYPTIETGSVSITPTAASTPTSADVTYSKTFSSVPKVFTTPSTSSPGNTVLGTSASNCTRTGCTVWVTRTNTVSTTVYWVAIG